MADFRNAIVLVMGSTAIDQTGTYQGSFATYQDRYPIDALNMSFQLGNMRSSFGGCAPNIAYGLNLLGINAIPLSSAGRNFLDRYQAHLESLGVNTHYIAVDEDTEHSATCLMLNDLEGNQIIGFYPGPGSGQRKLPSEVGQIDQVSLAILGPEEPSLTLRQAKDLHALGIPMVFDPGQVVTEYGEADIQTLFELSDYLIVNDFEAGVLETNSGLTREEMINTVGEVVITHGDRGAGVFTRHGAVHVNAAPATDIVESTGCGDAFRAGYSYGILAGMTETERAQLGCIMAMTNIETTETQKYVTSLDEVLALQRTIYGSAEE
jgi:adenosine kinase